MKIWVRLPVMEFFRRTDRRTLLPWVLLLVISFLCTQGASLHTHELDHEDGYHDHAHVLEFNDHGHVSKAHLVSDKSHADQHSGVIFEIEISPDGLLKNINNSLFSMVFIVFFFTLMLLPPSRQLIQTQRCREKKSIFHRNSVISPPLRAPPQL